MLQFRRHLLSPFRRRLCSFSTSVGEPQSQIVYERKSPIEHVLLRPGMYIGEIEIKTADTWVYNAESKLMEKKSLTYSPGLLKVFIFVTSF